MRLYNLAIVAIALALSIGVAWSKYHIERKKHRKRRAEAIYSLIMDNSILAAIGAVLLLAVFILAGIRMDQEDFINIPMLGTLMFSGIIGLVLMVAREYVINKLEDSIKLSKDYAGLIKKIQS